MTCFFNQTQVSLGVLLDVCAKACPLFLSSLKFRHSPCNILRPLCHNSPLTNNDSLLDFVDIVKPDNQVAPAQPEFRAAAFDVTCSYPDRFLALAQSSLPSPLEDLFYFNCEFHPTFDMSPGEDFYSDTYEKNVLNIFY